MRKPQLQLTCETAEERKELNKLLTLLKVKSDKTRTQALIELIKENVK